MNDRSGDTVRDMNLRHFFLEARSSRAHNVSTVGSGSGYSSSDGMLGAIVKNGSVHYSHLSQDAAVMHTT